MSRWSRFFLQRRVGVESSDASLQSAGAVPGRTRGKASTSKYKYGVQTLYDPGLEFAIFDIVFVHGLTGNRLSTWTNNGSKTLWPKTLLSNDFSNTRILTIGYDADVVNYWTPASQNRVREHANALNSALCDLRYATKTTKRPIIFVAHSLGGVVVKDALLISNQEEESYTRDIYDSTIGVEFLGTPHRGAILANWAAWMGRFTNLVKKSNQDIIELLRPESEVHDRINQDFHKILAMQQRKKRPLKITCFFEELPILGIGEIVPKDSAILSGYEFRGIHGNHMDMTKFEDEHDPGYQSVCAVLARCMREYEESLSPKLSPATENPTDNDSSPNRGAWNQNPGIIYSRNNTAGGMVVQGNNINSAGGPIHFG